MKIKLSLSYNEKWIAKGEILEVSAETLEDLDKAIEEELKKKGFRGEIKVYMEFDYSTIPQWIRQFHPHYFNREIIFKID